MAFVFKSGSISSSDKGNFPDYLEVDQEPIDLRSVFRLVFSGKIVSDIDMESLMEYFESHGPIGTA